MSINDIRSNENEEVIDLRKFFKVVFEKKKILIGIIISCTVIAAVISFIMPKTYQSNATIRMQSLAATKAIELMKSNEVIEPVMSELNLSGMTVSKFISTNLSIVNPRNTDLITITAYGKTPEEAQTIVELVLDKYSIAVDNYNTEQNISTLNFLNEYMSEAEKEMKEAEDKLIVYQQEKNIPMIYTIENDVDSLPMDAEYIRLSRERKVTLEKYIHLMKAYENAKIGEIQKAVEFNVIEGADELQEIPVKPNKRIIIAIGFVLGVMIAIGYALYGYCRRYSINILK